MVLSSIQGLMGVFPVRGRATAAISPGVAHRRSQGILQRLEFALHRRARRAVCGITRGSKEPASPEGGLAGPPSKPSRIAS